MVTDTLLIVRVDTYNEYVSDAILAVRVDTNGYFWMQYLIVQNDN